jgi:hypothetical protein
VQQKRPRVEDERIFAPVVLPSFSIVSAQRLASDEQRVFSLSPEDTLESMLSSVVPEINSLFIALGYPADMLHLRDGRLPNTPLWQGLACLDPSLPGDIHALAQQRSPTLAALRSVMDSIPANCASALPGLAGASLLPSNLPLLLAILPLVGVCEPPFLFGRRVDTQRVLSFIAGSPHLRWSGSPTAVLWTPEVSPNSQSASCLFLSSFPLKMDRPALLPLSDEALSEMSQGELRALVAGLLFVPEKMVTLLDEVQDNNQHYSLKQAKQALSSVVLKSLSHKSVFFFFFFFFS